MRNLLTLFLTLLLAAGQLSAHEPVAQTQVVSFRFVAGKDIFYTPWAGNGAELERLCALLDEYRTAIAAGNMPVHVDSYCVSQPSGKENLRTAFVRANRVKSELIVRKGLKESDFRTATHAESYGRQRDVVVVTLRIPAPAVGQRPASADGQRHPAPAAEASPHPAEPTGPVPVSPQDEAVDRDHPARMPSAAAESPVAEAPVNPTAACSRWSVGANIGLPFFWGDFTSLSADKTYMGVSLGLQATYQIVPALGITLSLDWARNKAGARDYAAGYLLDVHGMTWYTPRPGTTRNYGELYSAIDMFSAGLHLDVNINALFGPTVANARLKVLVSPAVYAQRFDADVCEKKGGKRYVDRRLAKDVSIGLGGDLVLRYDLSRSLDLQLKGTAVWINDNDFDNISTVGYVKHNAFWGVSAGVVWKIGGKSRPNLLHKKK